MDLSLYSPQLYIYSKTTLTASDGLWISLYLIQRKIIFLNFIIELLSNLPRYSLDASSTLENKPFLRKSLVKAKNKIKGTRRNVHLYTGLAIGPATRCDKTGHISVILGFWKHRRPSQTIAGVSSKIAAVWPVSYSRWNVFIFSCDVHRTDGNWKYLTDNFYSHIT